MPEQIAIAGGGAISYLLLDTGIPVAGLGSFLWPVFVMFLVCFAAYLTTKFIASRGRGTGTGRYMQIKESLLVSRDKSIMLLEAGRHYYIVGVTNQSMQLLGAIDKSELPPLSANTNDSMQGFKSSIMRMLQNMQTMKQTPEQRENARLFSKQTEQETKTAEIIQPEESPVSAPETGLHLLRKTAGKTKKQETVKTPEGKPLEAHTGAPAIMKENSFLEHLSNESEKLLHSETEVILELSRQAEQQPKEKSRRPGKQGKAMEVTSREDEIDKMMQSIAQRTQQLKQKRVRNDDDAQE